MKGDVEGLRPELQSTLRMLEYLANKHFPVEGAYELYVTSGVREDAGHRDGWAADIQIEGGWHRRLLVEKAIILGVPRIGVYDRHVEINLDPNRVQDVLWVGKSQPLKEKEHGETPEDVETKLSEGFQEGCE